MAPAGLGCKAIVMGNGMKINIRELQKHSTSPGIPLPPKWVGASAVGVGIAVAAG